MTELAEKLNYHREVVRVWFCNRRQALKNNGGIKRIKMEEGDDWQWEDLITAPIS